ncbi:MAG: hypothetical protein IPK66_17330 [Rhodospirillales bacterium]|nr:hypothetical protein [Rhodospirillales bacterium]
MGHPAGRFRRRFDLRRLAESMKDPWPFALHALRRGHLDVPLDHPTWGMALSSEAFLRRHDLLDATDTGWRVREARAEAVLAAQLGAPWREAPLHARALAGLLALRVLALTAPTAEAERLKRRALALLGTLARAAADHKAGDYLPPAVVFIQIQRETEPALRAEALAPLLAGHAYTATVLLRLLAEAREGGVLPPALFTWLKGVDRPLWYALNSLGRRMPFVEAAGAIAHYRAERAAGFARPAPASTPRWTGCGGRSSRSRPPIRNPTPRPHPTPSRPPASRRPEPCSFSPVVPRSPPCLSCPAPWPVSRRSG